MGEGGCQRWADFCTAQVAAMLSIASREQDPCSVYVLPEARARIRQLLTHLIVTHAHR